MSIEISSSKLAIDENLKAKLAKFPCLQKITNHFINKVPSPQQAAIQKLAQIKAQKVQLQKEVDANLLKLNEFNSQKQQLSKELALSKFFLKTEYFTQLSQLKSFVKKNKEDDKWNKCQEHNSKIESKLGELSAINDPEIQSKFETKTEIKDQQYITKFISRKRNEILSQIDPNDSKRKTYQELQKALRLLRKDFSSSLQTHEPYLQEKVEDSVKKMINIIQKEKILTFLEGIASPSEEKKSAQKKKKAHDLDEPRPLINILSSQVDANKKALSQISGIKIQTNEFIAVDFIELLDNACNASHGVEQALIISSKNLERLSVLPSLFSQAECAEDLYSASLQSLAAILNQPNKYYFYLADKFLKLFLQIKRTPAPLREFEENQPLQEKREAYERKRKNFIKQAKNLTDDVKLELEYVPNLKSLMSFYEISPGFDFTKPFRLHEGQTVNDFLLKWIAKFSTIHYEGNKEMISPSKELKKSPTPVKKTTSPIVKYSNK